MGGKGRVMVCAAEEWNHNFFHTQAVSKQELSGALHHTAEQNLLHLLTLRVLRLLHSECHVLPRMGN